MADLHPVAKRIHNVQPDPVRLTVEGSGEGGGDEGDEGAASGVYRFDSTEFFQREFRGEGTRVDADTDAAFRLISSEDYERILLGRQGPEEEGWRMVGEVVAAERADGE
ncbi:hypothetical protein GCM10027435_28450 [Haloparvum alkalitolerans]|uniref:transcriptional regulator n=1 Tax=Haloparvum alkalitolerans TaxID=1042953 RepID=UPI003CEA8B7D